MDMSWQTTFALACAAVFAAVVPGTLGYTTARLETADRQRQEVVRLRSEIQTARNAIQRISTPCTVEGRGTTRGTGPAGAEGTADSSADAPDSRPREGAADADHDRFRGLPETGVD